MYKYLSAQKYKTIFFLYTRKYYTIPENSFILTIIVGIVLYFYTTRQIISP